jgi:cytochrome c oxidase cbb3-type subunit 3/ubiquinol-cytochrome c reductase cytochrome c subunit
MKARLRWLAVGVAMLALSAGCGPWPGKPKPGATVLRPGEIKDFGLLYGRNCAGCHGADGRGSAALPLNNPVYLEIAGDEALRKATALGVAGTLMPAFARSAGGELTDDQIELLVKEMRSRWSNREALQGATPPPYAPDSAGAASRGAEVYTTYCAACHGTAGTGTPKGSSIVDGAYLALVSDQGLRTTIIAGRPDLRHPDWRNFLPNRPLTGREVTDLVAWLASHRRADSLHHDSIQEASR